MEELQQLNKSLGLLLKKHTALQAENERLKKTIAAQQSSIDALNQKFVTLEESMVAMQLGKNILSDAEKDIVRKQLDTVIGEIDKILTTLND